MLINPWVIQRSSTVQRSRVSELHYITSLKNLGSIASRGVLSHTLAADLEHESVALESVQDIREGKTVPGQGKLHEYANLYFDARNPMMYTLRVGDQRSDLIVVRIAHEAMDIEGAVLTDGNAASGTTRFLESPRQLDQIDDERTFAVSWDHDNPFVKAERKRQRCAEVLVPNVVPSSMLIGCYVERRQVALCQSVHPDFPVEVNSYVFFR